MTTHKLAVPTSDGGGHGAGGGVTDVGSRRLDAGGVSASATHSPPPAPPYTVEEYDALIATIWTDLDDDPSRFADLLTSALAFMGRRAVDLSDPRAAELLREMEQRALWGPDHEQEDHR